MGDAGESQASSMEHVAAQRCIGAQASRFGMRDPKTPSPSSMSSLAEKGSGSPGLRGSPAFCSTLVPYSTE